jgi:hypothetical protein
MKRRLLPIGIDILTARGRRDFQLDLVLDRTSATDTFGSGYAADCGNPLEADTTTDVLLRSVVTECHRCVCRHIRW